LAENLSIPATLKVEPEFRSKPGFIPAHLRFDRACHWKQATYTITLGDDPGKSLIFKDLSQQVENSRISPRQPRQMSHLEEGHRSQLKRSHLHNARPEKSAQSFDSK
jgi:hypothetical protein